MGDAVLAFGDKVRLYNSGEEATYGRIVGMEDDDCRIVAETGKEICVPRSSLRYYGNIWNCTPQNRTTLTDGTQVYPGHRETITDGERAGQQKDYVVLSEEERGKGFVRPVRRSYIHEKCGVVTTMGQSLAETYARDPKFYNGTFCCGCGAHFPVGPQGEFLWDGTQERVGT